MRAWRAAQIAAQLGHRVGLLTMPGVAVGSTPCNPSVGGVGKAQVVREIDFLGGLMGQLADRAGIHYKTLNLSKGYALRSTRVQVDKERYSQEAQKALGAMKTLTVWAKKVLKIAPGESGGFVVSCQGGECFRGEKVVVTTGTFLGGRLHVGGEQSAGGRVGQPASGEMGDLFCRRGHAPGQV